MSQPSSPARRAAAPPAPLVAAPGRPARRRGERVLAGFAALVTAIGVMSLFAPSASAALSAVGPASPYGPAGNTSNFPSFYTDTNGLSLQPCLDGLPNCLTAAADLVNPDGEGFYFAADTTVGPFAVDNHLEAAYLAKGPGQEVTFMRTQVAAPKGGLVPNATYTIIDPYTVDPNAPLTCTADSGGVIKNNGCRTETVPVPGEFNRALAGRVNPFLTWDTYGAAADAPPAGYIGDNVTPHKVIGSPTGFNKVRIIGPGLTGSCANADGTQVVVPAGSTCAETDLFVVQGKVQASSSASVSPAALDFGNVAAPVTKTVTYTSTGANPAVVTGVTLGGTNPNDFAVTKETCTTAPAPGLATSATCTADVTFTPRANSTSSATLTIADNTAGSPRNIPLTGSNNSALTLDRTSIAFGAQKAATTSANQFVVVGNTGTAPATVTSAALGGTGAAHFKITSNGCTAAVAPGNGCEIGLAFAPTTSGDKTATLTVTDENQKSYTTALTGTGTAPAITASATSLAFGNQNTGTASAAKTVVLTNGGTAPFTVDGTDVTGADAGHFQTVFPTINPCAVGATVAPGATCTIQVKFAPTAGGAKAATLAISADGQPANVALSGTGVVPATAPATPAAPTATLGANNSATVGWTAPNDGGSAINGYTVNGYIGTNTTPAVTATSTTTSATVTGLLNGQSYTFRVAATNTVGTSAESPPSGALTPTAAPDKPAAPTATAGNASATVTWTAPNTNGAPITAYTVKAYAGATVVATVPNITGTSTTVTGLTNGTANTFTVTATNSAGTSTESAQSAAVTPAAAPGAPTIGTATAGNASATVTWTAPASNGGSTITGYEARAYGGTTGTTVLARATAGATATGVAVTGLTNGTSYTLRVVAINAAGTSGESGRSNSVTPAAAATDTTAPTVTARTPAVNATAVAGTSTVTATFSEAVQGFSGTSFTLKNPAGTTVAANVTYNATTRVATLSHTAALANDTKYTVTLTGGATAIRDNAGNALAPTSWTFTTGPAPTVTTRTPASGATGFTRTANITATFSEAVTGVSGTTVTLKNATTGATVTAVVSYNATTRVATLNPSATLGSRTLYTVTLTGGTTAIRDNAGNPLANTTWNFTTGTV